MRMEELSDNRYIKGTDTVERYLLNLVQEYFKTANIASTTSREYVIKKAVERMKEEITFDSIGVLSITLPDGEKRTGAVTISLEDLNGEPLISPKLSAFNVNFGTEQNTACEGNDPRLSDARKPLDHKHEVSDITGLEGILSTLMAKADRVEDFLHEHDNKNILDMLVYTGDKTSIDLSVLDTLENKVRQMVTEVENEIIAYENRTNAKVTEVNQTITQVRSEIQSLSNSLVTANQKYETQAKNYVDNKVSDLKTFITQEINKMASATALNELLAVANNCFSLAGSMPVVFNSVVNTANKNYMYKATIPVTSVITNELTKRRQTLADCQIEVTMTFKNGAGKIMNRLLPFAIMKDYLFDGTFYYNINYTTNSFDIILETKSREVPSDIKECEVIFNIYSQNGATT